MIIIPPHQLHPDTLTALIEEFVTREGAIHGHTETPLAEQIGSVRRQLRRGDAVILFDEESESCTIIPKQELHAPPPEVRRIVVDE